MAWCFSTATGSGDSLSLSPGVGKVALVAAAAQWIANWLISSTFPALSDIGLGFAYFLYASFAFVALVFVWKAVKETKGRALESM